MIDKLIDNVKMINGQDAFKIAGFALAYFISHQIAFFFPDSGKVIMLVWPAGGIGLAAFLLNPRRLWPALTLVFYISGVSADILLADRSFMTGVGYMTGNMVESIGCAWLILYWSRDFQNFTKVREILALIIGTVFVNAFSSCFGAGTSVLTRGASFIDSWQSWFIADGLGVLVVGPFIVTWLTNKQGITSLRPSKYFEVVCFLTVWLLIVWQVFYPVIVTLQHVLHPHFLVALLAWPALRLGQRYISLALMILFVIAVFSPSIVNGPSPWGGSDVDLQRRLLELQLFMGFMAVVGYLLAAGHADSKLAEESLHHERDRAQGYLDTVEAIIVALDREGIITTINRKACQILGYSEAELLGAFWFDTCLPQPEGLEIVYPYFLGIVSNKLEKIEYNENSIITKSGDLREIAWHNSILRDENGQITAVLSAGQDITDYKRAEEEKQALDQQFQQTQKLESLGVLSGGIAHDFNNILAIIMGYCSMTKMDYETTENNIAEIEKAVERAAALCRQMLAYAGKAQLIKSRVNMRLLVDEMVAMLKSTIPQNAVIKPELSTEIPFINADASQLRQIVMNLIINASEAIGKEQGEIRVSLARTTVTADQSDKDYHGKEIPPGEYVCLEVTDNGCGMDEETKWRIFEPFYTTKFTGRGLGMSAVLGIITSHSGALQLFSQLGQGTTFKVFLPAQKRVSAEGENLKQFVPSVPWQGSGTILLVEDEDQVRHIAKTLLKNFGFTVLEAVNGSEALELYQKNAADISLVFTDMGMPVMDGCQLFHKLKKQNPELPIIISTGYADTDVTSSITHEEMAGFISKPYNPDQLREVLKRVLEGREPAHA